MEFQYLKISCYFISLHFDLFLLFVIIAFSICYQYDFRVADVINLTSFVSTDNVKYSVLIIFYWRHYWYWHHKIFNVENDEWYSSLGIWNKVWFKSSWTVSFIWLVLELLCLYFWIVLFRVCYFLSWNFSAKDKIFIKFCYTSVNFLTRLMCVWLMT